MNNGENGGTLIVETSGQCMGCPLPGFITEVFVMIIYSSGSGIYSDVHEIFSSAFGGVAIAMREHVMDNVCCFVF